MKIIDMRVNGITDPIGIDTVPSFSWKLLSSSSNVMQSSYEIKVFRENGALIWTSGTVMSRETYSIRYEGPALESTTEYSWSVLSTASSGETETAEEKAAFTTAILDRQNWSGKWIVPSDKKKPSKPGFGKQAPATMFRQEFTLKEVPQKAILYATCHGIYRLYVNGIRPDCRELAPEHTAYQTYLCYQTYDVTDLLRPGDNVIGMYVADGWYCGVLSRPMIKNMDDSHAVLFQLEARYPDGRKTVIGSDTSAETSVEGPIRSTDLFAGELYDARFEQTGWNKTPFSGNAWKKAEEAPFTYEDLRAQPESPVLPVMEMPVKKLIKNSKGETILDFGQVLAGRVRMKLDLPKDANVVLEHTEVLDTDDSFFMNIFSSFPGIATGCDQRDEFISNGNSCIFEPAFTYHGFRYVRISGISNPNPEDFKAVVISSEGAPVGSFECSNEDINRLYENTLWSQRSNMLSIPTDCPQREKAGWTGDIFIYARTALQNSDVSPFLKRWLRNLALVQDSDGAVPMVVPFDGNYEKAGKLIAFIGLGFKALSLKGLLASAGWGDSAVGVPWEIYNINGDATVLEDQYDSMKAWCDYVIKEAHTKTDRHSKVPEDIQRRIWNTGFHFGEWLIPSLKLNSVKVSVAETSKYTAPFFGWNSVNTMAKIAKILGKDKEAAYYGQIAADMKDAIRNGGVIDAEGNMPVDFMGAYVLALYFDLVPDRFREKFETRLLDMIRENGGCLDTGFLGTPYILDALCSIGSDGTKHAYDLLLQDKCPSWLFEVKSGGTSLWESWMGTKEDGKPSTISYNHYASGCVDDWIFRNIVGLTPTEPGFARFIVKPVPGGGIRWAKRTFESANGAICIEWHIEGDEFFLQVTVPCNTGAEIELPDGGRHSVGSGTYQFSCSVKKD